MHHATWSTRRPGSALRALLDLVDLHTIALRPPRFRRDICHSIR
ncbi:hypothetical protein ACWERW_32525 [Streptomyces sp. NPDC004012]